MEKIWNTWVAIIKKKKKKTGEKGRERENEARSETQTEASILICSVFSFAMDGNYKGIHTLFI